MRYEAESGRRILRDGKPIVYLAIVWEQSGRAIDPVEADELVKHIVELLNRDVEASANAR